MGVAGGQALVRLTSTLFTFLFAPFVGVPIAQSVVAINAHPLGVPVTAIIEFGDQYLGSELYNAKITVVEVVRGEKAWDIVKRASASNRPPQPALEYLLARVRVEFSARTSPAHYSYNLDETQFTVTTSDSQQFDAPTLAAAPKPSLKGTLKPGDRLEGWLVFLVPQKVTQPVMVFHEEVGTVSYTGGGTFFQLYARPVSAGRPKP
jgi:hypothetical protein